MYIHLQDFISGGKKHFTKSHWPATPVAIRRSSYQSWRIHPHSQGLYKPWDLVPSLMCTMGEARPRGGRAVELKGGRWHGSQKQRKRNDRKVTENVRVAAHQSSPHQIWRVFSSTWTPWNLAWRVASIFLWKKGNKNQVAKTRLGTSTNG
jgi:hypothetical protein